MSWIHILYIDIYYNCELTGILRIEIYVMLINLYRYNIINYIQNLLKLSRLMLQIHNLLLKMIICYISYR